MRELELIGLILLYLHTRMTAKTETFLYKIRGCASRAALHMPSGKPGMDMTLEVRIASILSDVIYGRSFTARDLFGLCPALGAFPDIILIALKNPPTLSITHGFGVAQLEFAFSLRVDDHAKEYVNILPLNVGAVTSRAHQATITTNKALEQTLAKCQQKLDLALADLKNNFAITELAAQRVELKASQNGLEKARVEIAELKASLAIFEQVRKPALKRLKTIETSTKDLLNKDETELSSEIR